MKSSKCFNCGQIGHYHYHCPLKTPNASKPFSQSPNNSNSNDRGSTSTPPRIYCRCGHGFCSVKTSGSVKNPSRDYYVCPIKRGKPCNGGGFIQFCDAPIDESLLQPPPYKYPECECGAGVCEKVMNPVMNKCYFSCPVGKDHGSCGYRISEEELLDNRSGVPVEQSILNFLKRNDLGERSDFPAEHPKRMRMMDKFESPSSDAASELPESEDAAPEASAPSTPVGFPDFEDADDIEDVLNSVPLDVFEREAGVLSPQSAPLRISCRRNLFPDHNIAGVVTDAELFGHYLVGWLGRLLFIHPSQGLKFLTTPQPYFSCFFQSFNLIIVPKQASNYNDSHLAINNLGEPSQLSSSCHAKASGDLVGLAKASRDVVVHTDISGDDVSLSQITTQGGSQRRPRSKAERKRQLALMAMQELLTDLECTDPHDHESMRVCAEDAFSVLDDLNVDYKHFSEYIWDFINCASAVADIDNSMENSLSLEVRYQLIEEERVRYAQIQEDCVKAEALLEASNQQRQRLREEVSELEAMLHEKQKQLNSCELESLEMETHLGELKRTMAEADTTIKGQVEEAELARRLTEGKQMKQMAAKAALEKAKLELEK